MNDSLQERIKASWSYAANAEYLYTLYENYQEGIPIELSWKQFFEKNPMLDHDELKVLPHKFPLQKKEKTSFELKNALKELVDLFIKNGHCYTQTNPLSAASHNELVSTAKKKFSYCLKELVPEGLTTNTSIKTVEEYILYLEYLYCKTLSIEVSSLSERMKSWCLKAYEHYQSAHLENDHQLMTWLLDRLVAADGFEKFLANKYPGAKRFSIEGADSLMIFLEEVIKSSTQLSNTKEVVIGMAHRGRLNVLVNLLGKSAQLIFSEFEGNYSLPFGSGDVKYHKGFSSDMVFDGKNVHVSLSFNPSHLEIVNPAVTGTVRARQDELSAEERETILPLIIHGDSSFSGQGVNMELINMSQTRAFGVEGSVHLIINNQIGFTTSNPADTRSSRYCSDLAKMIDSPVLHVNGDDPIAVYRAARFAAAFRKEFKSDVFIDLICYRRLGHNEADEPAVTQPLMYQFIRQHPTPAEVFGQKLKSLSIIDQPTFDEIKKENRKKLEQGLMLNSRVVNIGDFHRTGLWSPYLNQPIANNAITKVDKNKLMALGSALVHATSTTTMHSRVEKIYLDRKAMYADQKPLDWGAAELLAYASLVADGYSVRLSGQDTGRGTFFHRHALIFDQKSGDCLNPINLLPNVKGKFWIYDTLLSEEAALAFEYGYSGTSPNTLVIWEAQFGDFANGAQVVIDQFIASGLTKWMRHCGIVLLLPHGYEGQGPEHSSARIERFLQLAAQDNMRVCLPSTPAQLFHLLRLQLLGKDRHPLIIFSPKSFLRLKEAVSPLDSLAQTRFQEVIWPVQHDTFVKKIIFCSGKIYYDLLKTQIESQRFDVLLVRVEQLYPFPRPIIERVLKEHQLVNKILWVQEEPKNQGAWTFMLQRFIEVLPNNKKIEYVGRDESASPATGQQHVHEQEQKDILDAAFAMS